MYKTDFQKANLQTKINLTKKNVEKMPQRGQKSDFLTLFF
jgi:hypothetical protein